MITEHAIHKVFKVTVILKAINSALEILGGIVFLFTGSITSLVIFLTQQELVEDPNDFIATHVQHFIPYFTSHSQFFIAAYLISHGVIKLFLVIGLIRNKLWAYPVAIGVFGAFILYQIYRYTHTHSVFLVFLTVFDLFLIAITWHEYKYAKKYRTFP